MGGAILMVLGMIGAASLTLGTITSGLFVLATSDRKLWITLPLFAFFWGFGIVHFLT
jgi:hypothetical protein